MFKFSGMLLASKKLTKSDRERDHTLGSMSNSRLNMNLDREVKIDFQLEKDNIYLQLLRVE